MPRESLDRQVHHIEDEILLLGSMVEQAVLNALDALKQRDLHLASRIIKEDQLINDRRFAIENAVLILLATQSPVAHDLRLLTAMLEIIIELERMGDYAKGIALVTLRLGDAFLVIPMREFQEMGTKAVSMLHRALYAFINEDSGLAWTIFREDDQVDDLYNRVERIIVNTMIDNPENIDQIKQLLWVAHNLERTADRVTNICERTLFITSGEMVELDGTEDDDPE